MREILFRGKRTDNGEWEEGFVFDDGLIDSEKMFIGSIVIENNEITGRCFCEVDPATVGMDTGLVDCNNNPIYEGHIVKCNHSFFTAEAEKAEAKKPRKSYGKEIEKMTRDYFQCCYWRNYVVSFHDGRTRGQNGSDTCYLKQSYIRNHKVEIIGNIHDNPELLEVR